MFISKLLTLVVAFSTIALSANELMFDFEDDVSENTSASTTPEQHVMPEYSINPHLPTQNFSDLDDDINDDRDNHYFSENNFMGAISALVKRRDRKLLKGLIAKMSPDTSKIALEALLNACICEFEDDSDHQYAQEMLNILIKNESSIAVEKFNILYLEYICSRAVSTQNTKILNIVLSAIRQFHNSHKSAIRLQYGDYYESAVLIYRSLVARKI